MANKFESTNKVRDSIKTFLEKMKALDEKIPEDLAEDALEMTEEVKDALEQLETVDEEVDPLEITKDEGKEVEEEEIEKKVEDAFVRVMRKYGMVKDSSMRALDELEEEIEEKETEDSDCGVIDEGNEEEVTVDPEKINDSARELKKFIRNIKPVIASVKDSAQRKALSDSIAKFAGMTANDSYNAIMKAAKNSAKDSMRMPAQKAMDADYNFGMEVAKKFNPHYKKED